MAAFLLASGKFSLPETAQRSDIPEEKLAKWLEDWTEFQALVEGFRERFTEQIEEVADALRRDFPANLKFLQDAREGRWNDTDKIMNLRMRAALALLEKQAPRQSESGEGKGITIVINQEQTERFRKARAEVAEFDTLSEG